MQASTLISMTRAAVLEIKMGQIDKQTGSHTKCVHEHRKCRSNLKTLGASSACVERLQYSRINLLQPFHAFIVHVNALCMCTRIQVIILLIFILIYSEPTLKHVVYP